MNIDKQCMCCGNYFKTAIDKPHWFCVSNRLCRFFKRLTKR